VYLPNLRRLNLRQSVVLRDANPSGAAPLIGFRSILPIIGADLQGKRMSGPVAFCGVTASSSGLGLGAYP
jgi:hypothetical protein